MTDRNSSSNRRRKSRLKRRLHRAADALAAALQCGLIGLLILLPMPLGGREPWALPVVAAVVAALVACWTLEGALRGEFRLFNASYLLIPVGLLAVGLLQLLASDRFVAAVSRTNADRWEAARAAGFTDLASRISLAPAYTATTLAWKAATLMTPIQARVVAV